MKGTSLGLVGVAASALLVSLLAMQEASAAEEDQKSADALVPEAVVKLSGEQLDKKHNDAKFFNSASTTTYTAVTLFTSTVFHSCLSGTDGAVCNGRRRKKRTVGPLLKMSDNERSMDLDGSMDEEADKSAGEKKGVSPNDEKLLFGFTVWTTTRTTTSVTIFTTDDATTVSLSFFCVAGNIQLPPFPC